MFIRDMMSYIMSRGWCDIIVNVYPPSEDKSGDTKDSFHRELDAVFSQFLKHHMKILLGYFNAEVGKRIFLNQESEMRVYMKLIMIMGLE
jgi:hypothetical protein